MTAGSGRPVLKAYHTGNAVTACRIAKVRYVLIRPNLSLSIPAAGTVKPPMTAAVISDVVPHSPGRPIVLTR